MSLKNAWAYIVRLCLLPKPTSQAYLTSRATDTGGPRELLPQLLPDLLLCLCSYAQVPGL